MGCSSSHVLDSFAEENLQLHLELMFELYGKPTEQVSAWYARRGVRVRDGCVLIIIFSVCFFSGGMTCRATRRLTVVGVSGWIHGWTPLYNRR